MRIKQILSLSLVLLLGTLALQGCKDDKIKSLSELKDEQRDAINRLISDKGLRVVGRDVNNLPETIDPAVYYHLPNGLYIRVLNEGSREQSVQRGTTKVYVELKGAQFTKENYPGVEFDNLSKAGFPPIGFVYTRYYSGGEVHFEPLPRNSPQNNLDALMSEGIAFPLSLKALGVSEAEDERLATMGTHIARLGNGARLSLIVPFEIGPQQTYSTGAVTFIEEADYTIQ